MLRRKFIPSKAFTKKEERFQINDLKKLQKEEQIKPKIKRWKEIIKSRTQ